MSNQDDLELSEHEMQALKELFDSDDSDRWFLLKFQLILLVAAYYVVALGAYPELIVAWLELEQGPAATDWEFIFRLRGLFIGIAMLVAIQSYRHDLQMRLIFGGAAAVALMNFVMDVPVFYLEKLAEPNLLLFAILLGRISIVVLLFLVYANLDRIPPGPRRVLANPFVKP